MRIILSRKGFDSENGGMPSPIMPDGTLLSFPIPSKDGNATYHDLVYQDKTYYEIMQELSPAVAKRLKKSHCHVDPDLSYRYRTETANWQPAFGQCGLSQLHLQKHNIGTGDVFLFYGWFRQTEYDSSGKLKFVSPKCDPTPDRHIIYGYMEIGEIITERDKINRDYSWHPHTMLDIPDNVLYVSKNNFSLDSMTKGSGLLKYAPIRQLTMERHKRSEWGLPECFRNIEITFHETDSYGWIDGLDYFKSAHIGQEFIIKQEVDGELTEWLLNVILQ